MKLNAHARLRATREPVQNPIICVDFDGVVHSYKSGWQGIDVIPDPPVPGAIKWLLKHLPKLNADGSFSPYSGPIVQIYSARSKESKGIRAIQRFLVANGLPKAYITQNVLQFPTQKPAAFLTIDDCAICFTGKFPTTEEMLAFKPWYERS